MRYVLEDPELSHQIVLRTIGQDISVSCNCLVRVAGATEVIDMRPKWTTPEVIAAWAAWHEIAVRTADAAPQDQL